jgi:hypothetical protein
MKIQCQAEQERSATGMIQKRIVLQAVGEALGVSECALVLRLLELSDLLCVLIRVQWDLERPERPRYFPPKFSRDNVVTILEGQAPDPTNLLNDDGWEHEVGVQTKYGQRVIHGNAWRRQAAFRENGALETWVFGWGWNAFPLSPWDDSEHKGAMLEQNGTDDH